VTGPNGLVSSETWNARGIEHFEIMGWARRLTPFELQNLDDELRAAGYPLEEKSAETVEPFNEEEPKPTKKGTSEKATPRKKAAAKPATKTGKRTGNPPARK
jgi:hypothetical protein